MQQIYHIEEQPEDRYVLDPQRGPVMRRESIMKPSGTEKLSRGDKTYEVRPDGTFLVDDETATYLLSRPGWHTGANPFFVDAEIAAASAPKVTKVGART